MSIEIFQPRVDADIIIEYADAAEASLNAYRHFWLIGGSISRLSS